MKSTLKPGNIVKEAGMLTLVVIQVSNVDWCKASSSVEVMQTDLPGLKSKKSNK